MPVDAAAGGVRRRSGRCSSRCCTASPTSTRSPGHRPQLPARQLGDRVRYVVWPTALPYVGDRRPARHHRGPDPRRHRRARHRHAGPGPARSPSPRPAGRRAARCTRSSSSPGCSASPPTWRRGRSSGACCLAPVRTARRCRHDRPRRPVAPCSSSACRCVLLAVWWFASAGSTDFYQPPLSDDPGSVRGDLVRRAAASTTSCRACSASPPGYLLAAGRRHRARRADRHRAGRVRDVLEPVLEFLRAIPPPVLVPVIMLFAGIGDTMKVLVIVVRLRLADPAQHRRGRARRRRGARRHLPVLPHHRRRCGCGTWCCAVGQPADRHRRPAGAVDRHHPHGHQRDVRGQQRPRVHHRPVPARLRRSRRCGAACCCSASSASCCRCCSGSSRTRVLAWYHGLRARTSAAPDNGAVDARRRDLRKVYDRPRPQVEALREPDLPRRRGRVRVRRRPVRLRQDHAAAVPGGPARPTAGEVLLAGARSTGRRPAWPSSSRSTGAACSRGCTCGDNVELPLKAQGARQGARARAGRPTRWRRSVWPTPTTAYPWQLSGGMQQRVAIAPALSRTSRRCCSWTSRSPPSTRRPAPTSRTWSAHVWQQLGVTVLFVTHDIDEAVYLGQRVIVLSVVARPSCIEDLTIDLPDERDQLTPGRSPLHRAARPRLRTDPASQEAQQRRERDAGRGPDPQAAETKAQTEVVGLRVGRRRLPLARPNRPGERQRDDTAARGLPGSAGRGEAAGQRRSFTLLIAATPKAAECDLDRSTRPSRRPRCRRRRGRTRCRSR